MASELSTQISTAVLHSTNAVQVRSNSVVAPAENVKKADAIDIKAKAQENSSMEKASVDQSEHAVKNVSKNEVDQALTEIKAQLGSVGREINFAVDEDLNIVIIKVVNKDTEEVIRQIPTEEVVEIARNIQNNKGFLFEEEA